MSLSHHGPIGVGGSIRAYVRTKRLTPAIVADNLVAKEVVKPGSIPLLAA